jgi:hypothetical protein
MGKEDAYHGWLEKSFGELIDSLELEKQQKLTLKNRWLDQIIWMEGKAKHTQRWYYFLRLTAIIGGLIIPALIGFNMEGPINDIFRWIVFSLSLAVAIASAVEEFFQYGERWRHYRKTVEVLKSEGWQFFQLSGAYAYYETHKQAYEKFTGRVESMLQADVQKYIAEIVKEEVKEDREDDQ